MTEQRKQKERKAFFDFFKAEYEVIKSIKELQEEELKQFRELYDRFYGITIEEDKE